MCLKIELYVASGPTYCHLNAVGEQTTEKAERAYCGPQTICHTE